MKRTGAETMQTSPYLKQAVLEAVKNQLRDGNPPETAETLAHLMEAGCTKVQAMEKIAVVLVEHIYTTLQAQKPFDGAAYIRDLKNIT